MSAEQLIALEAILADLSALYPVARSFRPLVDSAEGELLPFLGRLGGRLRQLRRRGGLDDEAVAATSTEILATAAHWNEELDRVQRSPLYGAALAALRDDQQKTLGELIPELLTGYSRIQTPRPLYFPMAITAGRRRPGASPFLHPKAAAEQIIATAATGIRPQAEPGPWWESELPTIVCAADPAALATTVALVCATPPSELSVFALEQESTLRILTPLVGGPFSVVLASEAEDEWWEAYEDDYALFRQRLQTALEEHGLQVVSTPAPPHA